MADRSVITDNAVYYQAGTAPMINTFSFLFSIGAVFVVVIRAAILDRIEQRARLLSAINQQVRP